MTLRFRGCTGQRLPLRAVGSLCTGIILTGAAAVPAHAQDDRERHVVVRAARVITVSGEDLSPGMIVITDGVVVAVGKSIEYPPGAQVINARTETVMPGLVHVRSRYGLRGYSRSGVRGDVKVADEVYLDHLDFEPLLKNGFTSIAFIPDGSELPGMASAYRTAGPSDKRLLADTVYLRMAGDLTGRGKNALRNALKKAREEIDKVEKARKEWEEKQKAAQTPKPGETPPEQKPEPTPDPKPEDKPPADQTARVIHADRTVQALPPQPPAPPPAPASEPPAAFTPPPIDPAHKPLVDLIQKKPGARMVVELDRASDWIHLQDVLKPYDGLPYSLHLGRSWSPDFNYIAEEIGKSGVYAAMPPLLHYLPDTTVRYNLAASLVSAGARLICVPAGDAPAELERYRKRVAELVRSGLSRGDALKSLTLYPACMLGLESRIGTIEKGRDADLIFLNGDPLDGRTSVQRVMILGEVVWKAKDTR